MSQETERVVKLTEMFQELIDFSDWCYENNNGNYSKERANKNKYITRKFTRSNRSGITVDGRDFFWSYNQRLAGRKLWSKGFLNYENHNLVYDRSDEDHKKIRLEIFHDKDHEKEVLNEISNGKSSPTAVQVAELVEDFWDYLEQPDDSDLVARTITKLKKSKNLILHGAPGTGKSYLAKEIAARMIGINQNQLNDSEQFQFVQFHPSYDYTDFVEGLRPVVNDDSTVGFELQDGIFKDFVGQAIKANNVGTDNFDEVWEKLVQKVEDEAFISITNISGRGQFQIEMNSTGDGLVTRSYAGQYGQGEWIKGQNRFFSKEQLYNVYQGLPGVPKGGLDNYRKAIIRYMSQKLALKKYVSKETSRPKPYIFVIDEINRGEISKILGELFYAIDPEYRGKSGAVQTQYANLHGNTEKFYVPANVYLIGTMNDIDRSVDSFDFAMRRRFRFIEITAEQTISMWQGQLADEVLPEAKQRLIALNQQIVQTEDLNPNYQIGPSYFLKLPEVGNDFAILWSDYLEPLLAEYVRGGYDEEEKLLNLKNAYELRTIEGFDGDED